MHTYRPKEDQTPAESITGRHIMDTLSDSQRLRIEELKRNRRLGTGELYRKSNNTSASHKRGDTMVGFAPVDAVARLGAAFSTLGVSEHAASFYEQALEGYRESRDRTGEATILMSLAQCYWDGGELEKAVDTFDSAADIFYKLNMPSEQAAALNCVGLIYSSQDQPDLAAGNHEQALSILFDAGDHSTEAATLDVLGMAQRRCGQYQEALIAHQNALVLRREHEDKIGEAISLHALALIHEEMCNTDKAILFYEQALAIRQRSGDRPGELVTSYNLARMYEKLGHFDLAESLLTRVVELERLLNHPDLAKDEAELMTLRMQRRAQRQRPEEVEVDDLMSMTQVNRRFNRP